MTTDKKTILIVDDESDLRVYLSTFLEDNGFSTVTAEDGAQAMAKVEESRPDLVTLDISMPEKSGVKFYREMKENEELCKIPIVIITGLAKDFEKFISTRRQVPPPEGYIRKPVEQDEVLSMINKLIS